MRRLIVALLGPAFSVIVSALRHRSLLLLFAGRDMIGGRAGQALALFWVFAQPTLMVLAYTAVFSTLFRNRLVIDGVGRDDYPIYILSGLVPWVLSSEVLQASCDVMRNKKDLIQNVPLATAVVPLSALAAKTAPFLLQLAVLLGIQAVWLGGIGPWTLLLVPAMVIHALLLVGLLLFIASVSVFAKSIAEFVRLFTAVGIFLAPIFYVADNAPLVFQVLIRMNPFSYIVDWYHGALFYHGIREPMMAAAALVIALFCFFVGAFVYQRLERHFSNAL